MKVTSLLFALLFAACATSPNDPRSWQTVEILSEPPGARIEVNGNYIGNAPLTTKIRVYPNDKVAMGKVTVKALPAGPGQYEQVKTFEGPEDILKDRRDVVPTRILFQMNRKQ